MYIRVGSSELEKTDVINRLVKLLLDYSEGAGSPSGNVTPAEIGEWYFDTNAKAWYRSTGYENTDWQAL